jgi:thiol-disulfide isomerase/thioredoxin
MKDVPLFRFAEHQHVKALAALGCLVLVVGVLAHFVRTLNKEAAVLIPIAERRLVPDFDATDMTGVHNPLRSYRGKVIVLTLWATWCKPCQEEIPTLNKINYEYDRHRVQVLGVMADQQEQDRELVSIFARERQIRYLVLFPEPTLPEKLGIRLIPTTMVLDRNGRLAIAFDARMTLSLLESALDQLL